MEAKAQVDWPAREAELADLLDRHRRVGAGFDCVVPVSGGKDGSYVAYTLRTRYGMNPLCVTVTPPLPLPLGEQNLRNFVASGFNHVSVNAHPNAMRVLDRTGFVRMGFPYFGWLLAIQTAVIRVARAFDVSLLFYGEDGEVEYGGTSATRNRAVYDIDYIKDIYLEGGSDLVLEESGLPDDELAFFRFPEESGSVNLDFTHWSYFENWDPYRNYLVAKEHCGLQEAPRTNAGTFTNFAQNDQALYALHAYLMYLKFGFGRATQDACIEVRRGAMDREQAVNLVRLYDGHFPTEFVPAYLDYYGMTEAEFLAIVDSWANRELFEQVDGRWRPTFEIS